MSLLRSLPLTSSPQTPTASRTQLAYLVGLILLVKVSLLLLDPWPAFHFGDSGAYLATALIGWIPPDRSFTFGFFLRPLVIASHSLVPVLMMQSLLSAGASIAVGLSLMRYFSVSFGLALTSSLLCALEPLQLMSERMIMAEALATFAFSLYLAASLEFLRTQRDWILITVQGLAVLLVSLRYSLLPLVILLSIALPLLATRQSSRLRLPSLIRQLVIAILFSQALLLGYRHLYGHLAQTRAAYLSRDGDFLVSDVSPIVKAEDFPIPPQRANLLSRIAIPLRQETRRFHRWVPGGLCDAILQIAGGDEELANRLARQTAFHAIKRDLAGFLHLGLATYGDFLNCARLNWSLKLEAGHFVSPTTMDVTTIQNRFGVNARDRHFDSLTKCWESMAIPWCWVIVLLPWLYLLEMRYHRRLTTLPEVLLVVCSIVILLAALFPVEFASPRYLMPLPWLSCLILGIMASRLKVLSHLEDRQPNLLGRPAQ